MNNRTLLMLLPAIATLLLLACKDKAPAAAANTDEPPATTVTAQDKAPQFGGPAKGDSLFFFLERTPCFGRCKAYRISVYRSGYAQYEGRLNVEKEGLHDGRIGADTLALLLNEAERIGFFDMKDSYDAEVTDLPSTIVKIYANGKGKRVLARVGTPPAFKAYVEQVEALLLPVPWKPLPAKD
jgi:hypothetical protein